MNDKINNLLGDVDGAAVSFALREHLSFATTLSGDTALSDTILLDEHILNGVSTTLRELLVVAGATFWRSITLDANLSIWICIEEVCYALNVSCLRIGDAGTCASEINDGLEFGIALEVGNLILEFLDAACILSFSFSFFYPFFLFL